MYGFWDTLYKNSETLFLPECLLSEFCIFSTVEESTKNIVKTAAIAVGSLKETEFDIRFNPDVYSPGIRHAENLDAPLPKQRQLVKDAAEFLLTVQIPTFVRFVFDFLGHRQV